MNWILIALISPALWSVSNHIDKYLITKYFKGGGIGALIIFSSMIGFIVLPFVAIFHPGAIAVSPPHALLAMSCGVIWILSVLAYLYAMQEDEASYVAPLYQLIPIFAFILGWVFLGETLTGRQMLGSLIVVLGGVSLSIELNGTKTKFKKKVFFLMLLSSFLVAVGWLIFKSAALETQFWSTVFWSYAGDALLGLVFLLFVPKYRQQFVSVIRSNKIPVIGLNAFNELITLLGGLNFSLITLSTPLALVSAINGFQPFFIFLYGVLLTLFFPKLGTETLARKQIIQKMVTIAVMILGTYILST